MACFELWTRDGAKDGPKNGARARLRMTDTQFSHTERIGAQFRALVCFAHQPTLFSGAEMRATHRDGMDYWISAVSSSMCRSRALCCMLKHKTNLWSLIPGFPARDGCWYRRCDGNRSRLRADRTAWCWRMGSIFHTIICSVWSCTVWSLGAAFSWTFLGTFAGVVPHLDGTDISKAPIWSFPTIKIFELLLNFDCVQLQNFQSAGELQSDRCNTEFGVQLPRSSEEVRSRNITRKQKKCVIESE